MMTTQLLIAAIAAAGLAGSPFAAQAKANEHLMHYVSTMQSGTYGATGPSITQSSSYGTSGTSVGTVTAPSVGSYNWPSVGVTSSVPTWSNTNPAARK
jgi:hypothetical protein